MDYRALITSEHQQPKFLALVDAICNQTLGATAAVIFGMIEDFDLDQCAGAQEDILGLWIGQSRIVPGVLAVEFFGFDDDPAALPFGEESNPSIGGRFYEEGEPFSSTSILGDPDYKTVLRAKIVRNQWGGSISGLEQAIAYILPGVPYSIADTNNRQVTITFPSTSVTGVQRALITQFDLLPRMGGVKYNYVFT